MAFSCGLLLQLGGAADGLPDSRVGSAAAEVEHAPGELLVAGVRAALQQRDGGHDLPGLAVAALRHLLLDPRQLHGVGAVLGQPLDGGDVLARRLADGHAAGANGTLTYQHCTCTALLDAAAVLGPCQSDCVPDCPE